MKASAVDCRERPADSKEYTVDKDAVLNLFSAAQGSYTTCECPCISMHLYMLLFAYCKYCCFLSCC